MRRNRIKRVPAKMEEEEPVIPKLTQPIRKNRKIKHRAPIPRKAPTKIVIKKRKPLHPTAYLVPERIPSR